MKLGRRTIDITGRKYNRLTALEYVTTNKFRVSVWLFKCSCGKRVIKPCNAVKSGLVKSCGCLNREVVKMKRGPMPVETRIKIGNSNRGANSSLWRGGKSKVNALIRASMKYKLWRQRVFERDNFKCVKCGLKGGWNKEKGKQIILNADHVKPFAFFPSFRFKLTNGRTLCAECHKKTSTFGKTVYKNELGLIA